RPLENATGAGKAFAPGTSRGAPVIAPSSSLQWIAYRPSLPEARIVHGDVAGNDPNTTGVSSHALTLSGSRGMFGSGGSPSVAPLGNPPLPWASMNSFSSS